MHVLLAHRGQPERLVGDRVLLGADAEEAAVEQPHRAGQHALAGELVGGLQVGLDLLAQPRQRLREARHLVELLGVPAGAPGVVVAVLLAPRGVDAGGLQVPVRIRTDPDVLPRRRDAELADAVDHLALGDALAGFAVVVREAAPRGAPGDPGA